MKRLLAFTLAVFLTACSFLPSGSGVAEPVVITAEASTVVAATPGPPPTDGPSPTPMPATPIPALGSGITPTQLKYRVLDQFPDFFFCDPDFYPIAREDETALSQQRFEEIQADQEVFQAILSHNNLAGTTTFTDEQKLSIYREYKRLNAIHFELKGNKYQFQIQTGAEGKQGTVITATIDSSGKIDVLQRQDSFPSCPICLAAGTLIDTPRGAVRVEDLQVGDSVWTVDESGERVSSSILRTGSVRVPASHQVVNVTLSDGRELWASPGHPTADGRDLGDLQIGDPLDGSSVAHLERVPYAGGSTFDILPAGDTGFYWANGILMGSTLHP